MSSIAFHAVHGNWLFHCHLNRIIGDSKHGTRRLRNIETWSPNQHAEFENDDGRLRIVTTVTQFMTTSQLSAYEIFYGITDFRDRCYGVVSAQRIGGVGMVYKTRDIECKHRLVHFNRHLFTDAGAWFNIKMCSYQYIKSHCRNKLAVGSSNLHNGNFSIC